ncbi:hypothetical protein TNCV_492721 [Trichonephila clavipes]|nr:hypothetical protein TNCV_492721 [Trichonephila clavipes]
MPPPVENPADCEVRAVIRFLRAEGFKSFDIHPQISEVYGENIMSDGMVRKWGYVKSLVYADKPQTLDHLEDNIRRVIADIRPQMLEKVIENWTSRLDYIRASRGSPMPEIIFKM